MRGRHEGPDVLHLHAGPPLEDEGGTRARLCVPRDCGLAHVSCLAEQAKILYAEAEENNLDYKALDERWTRWYTCSLCRHQYHGVVACALGWACWKTYLGRPEGDQPRRLALNQLGNGLIFAGHHEDASRYGQRFAQQRHYCFVALLLDQGVRVVVGRYEGICMFLALELRVSKVNDSLHS